MAPPTSTIISARLKRAQEHSLPVNNIVFPTEGFHLDFRKYQMMTAAGALELRP